MVYISHQYLIPGVQVWFTIIFYNNLFHISIFVLIKFQIKDARNTSTWHIIYYLVIIFVKGNSNKSCRNTTKWIIFSTTDASIKVQDSLWIHLSKFIPRSVQTKSFYNLLNRYSDINIFQDRRRFIIFPSAIISM